MAQHISMINTPMKGLQKVSDSLFAKASQGLGAIYGSVKFREILHEEYKINPDDRVFITVRTVNGEREIFELHYDARAEKILDIFLVK